MIANKVINTNILNFVEKLSSPERFSKPLLEQKVLEI